MGKSTCTRAFTEAFLYFAYTMQRYIEHVHEEVSCKKSTFCQNDCFSNLAILYDTCIDSAYAGKSTCTTAFAETM